MNTIKLTIKSDICEPFNMLNKRLCKFKLFKNMSKQDCYILSIIKHNIITDAYSENIIKMDLQNMYNNSYVSSKDNTYEVYINSLDGKMNDTYWHNKLSDFATLKLPKTINNNNEDIIVNIDLPYLGTFAQKMVLVHM